MNNLFRHSLVFSTTLGFVFVAVFTLGSCSVQSPSFPRSPVRGVILISLDTLSAEHLSLYGYERNTSPFIDSLAQKAAVFDREIVQLPGTLPSHMSIFTGLYPDQHGVFPPDSVLAKGVPTIPIVLHAAGIHTGGHTEDGYVSGRYGFSRGFDEWDDTRIPLWTGGDHVFRRGMRFLKKLQEKDRFFLFLHTYAVHDPYTPPKRCQGLFWVGDPPPGTPPVASSGILLNHDNGQKIIPPEIAEYFEALYDEEIRCLDEELESFFAKLNQAGFLKDVVIIITADHGEEFLDHGKLGHEQIYNENVHVPLLFVYPGCKGVRIPALVQSIDLAPTIFDMMQVKSPPGLAGTSLIPLINDPEKKVRDWAYSRTFRQRGKVEKGLFKYVNGDLYHLLFLRPDIASDRQEVSIASAIQFKISTSEVVFEAKSFKVPSVLTIEVDGELVQQVSLSPESWATIQVPSDLGEGSRTLRLSSNRCEKIGPKGPCRSFIERGLPLRREELYRTAEDKREQTDLSRLNLKVRGVLSGQLHGLKWEPVSNTTRKALDPELEGELRALGYIE